MAARQIILWFYFLKPNYDVFGWSVMMVTGNLVWHHRYVFCPPFRRLKRCQVIDGCAPRWPSHHRSEEATCWFPPPSGCLAIFSFYSFHSLVKMSGDKYMCFSEWVLVAAVRQGEPCRNRETLSVVKLSSEPEHRVLVCHVHLGIRSGCHRLLDLGERMHFVKRLMW